MLNSKGVVLYEMLEGSVPYYEISSNEEVIDRVCGGLRLARPTKIETPGN